jgi:hypothetical protein
LYCNLKLKIKYLFIYFYTQYGYRISVKLHVPSKLTQYMPVVFLMTFHNVTTYIGVHCLVWFICVYVKIERTAYFVFRIVVYLQLRGDKIEWKRLVTVKGLRFQ